MNPLQYTSEEMFSSTELIRKSKMVFDKLQKNEIEKAIILRDGKPSFMLLDFSTYEDIMSEYLSLKELLNNQESVSTSKNEHKEELTTNQEILEPIQDEDFEGEDFEGDDFENALAQIDALDLDELEIESSEKKSEEDKESLREFWE